MDDLLDLSPRQFEDLVADYLRNQGFAEVQRVGGAGDLGVDIRCKDEYGRLVVAQCKRYRPGAKIGSPEIQTFFGMAAHHGASRGIFITSSNFTEPAKRLARERDIELITGAQIQGFFDAQLKRRKAEEEAQRAAQEARRRQREEALARQEVYARSLAEAAQRQGTGSNGGGAVSTAHAPSEQSGLSRPRPELTDFSSIGVEPKKSKEPVVLPPLYLAIEGTIASLVSIGSAIGAYHLWQDRGWQFWLFTGWLAAYTAMSIATDLWARGQGVTKAAANNELTLTALDLLMSLLGLVAAASWDHFQALVWPSLVLLVVLQMAFAYSSACQARYPRGVPWRPFWLRVWEVPFGLLFYATAVTLVVRYWPL